MTEHEQIEQNLKAVGVLLASISMENLGALIEGVYVGPEHKDLRGACQLSFNHLNRLSKTLKRDMGAKGTDPDVDRTLRETLDIVYALADLDEVERKRVVGLMEQIKKKKPKSI